MYRCAYSGDFKDHNVEESELTTVCAGVSIVEECDCGVTRTNGLPDYQVIYIKRGVGYYRFNDKFTKVRAGNAIIFHPDEPQIYKYYRNDCPTVCWIHFGGKKTYEILEKLNIADKRQIVLKNGNVIWEAANKIMDEFMRRDMGYEQAANALLITALVSLSRNNSIAAKSEQQQTIELVCEKIQKEYSENCSNEYYAEYCGLSTSHFLTLFKRFTGTTPHNYKLNFRLTLAKDMLINTDYKIKDISQMVGFNDSMYFCKYFAKHFKIPPTRFRALYRNRDE